MEDDRYSTHDAKARFSELVRKVREGRSVTITYRGEPVAELRPIERLEDTEARIDWRRSWIWAPAGAWAGRCARPWKRSSP